MRLKVFVACANLISLVLVLEFPIFDYDYDYEDETILVAACSTGFNCGQPGATDPETHSPHAKASPR